MSEQQGLSTSTSHALPGLVSTGERTQQRKGMGEPWHVPWHVLAVLTTCDEPHNT